MKRLLLTGANGFIGRHALPHLLARGFEVHAVSSRERGADDAAGAHWIKADLLVSEEVAEAVRAVRPTHLLHLAWEVVPGKFWTSGENLRWVEASLQLLREFARAGGRRVLMAGSCAEYDWREGCCSELTTPLAPRTLYGACKHALQLVTTSASRELNLSAAWGRIFFLYGPFEAPARLVPQVIRGLLKGERVACTEGSQLRDFLYVEDVASAFAALLDSDVTGALNIASGTPVSIREVVTRIAEELHGRDLVDFGALPVARDEPPLLVADVSRLRDEVGWTPAFNLDEGISRSIEWWRSRL